MKLAILAALLLASSSIACGSGPAATQAGAASPVEVNMADWTPPGEQMSLPDAPSSVAASAHTEAPSASPLRPTVFSEGKKGALVTLPTKRAN